MQGQTQPSAHKRHRLPLPLLFRISLTTFSIALITISVGSLLYFSVSLLLDPIPLSVLLRQPSIGILMATISCMIVVFIFTNFFISFFFLYLAHGTWMITSAGGLEIQGMGFKVSTSWDNIERIGQHGLGEALFLRQSYLIQGNKTIAILSRYIPENQFIRLGRARWWRDSDLGQEIKRYVPHLFISKDFS